MDETPYRTIRDDSSSWSAAQFFSLRTQAQRWLVPTLLSVAVVVGSWIAVGVIERTFRQNLEKKLSAIIAATASSVALWSEQQTLHARIITSDDRIETLVRRLLGADDAASKLDQEQESLQARLSRAKQQFAFESLTVCDSSGVVLATTDQDASSGRVADSVLSQFSHVFCGETVLAEPTPNQVHDNGTVDADSDSRSVTSTLRVATPIQNRRGDILATLICTIAPDEQFQRILDVSRFGETGDNYAVDGFGNTLCRDSKTDRLDSSIHLAAQFPRDGREFQQVVVNADGFLNTSGRKVVSASKWLPEYGIGVVSTIDYAEAYASHNLFKRMNWFVTGLAIAGALSGLCYTWLLSRAQLRAMQAEKKLRKLGHYSLEEKIGEGGMGEVYRATHALLRRPTAVKLLRVEKCSTQAIERFEREVQFTAQLTHPNTISIYDFGRTDGGVFFYAMEYLDGLDLKKVVERFGPLPDRRIVHILRQVCGSLKEAHDCGHIHRDIKPANVILCRRGGHHDVAKVLDFGLVHDVNRLRDKEVSGITGTPAFMSPESIRTPNNVDLRSDIYSLGAMAYFLIAGDYTFKGTHAAEIWEQQLTQLPSLPSSQRNTSISSELEELTMRCLAIEPDDRPANIDEVVTSLLQIERNSTEAWTQDDAATWWGRIATDHDTTETEQIAETLDLLIKGQRSNG